VQEIVQGFHARGGCHGHGGRGAVGRGEGANRCAGGGHGAHQVFGGYDLRVVGDAHHATLEGSGGASDPLDATGFALEPHGARLAGAARKAQGALVIAMANRGGHTCGDEFQFRFGNLAWVVIEGDAFGGGIDMCCYHAIFVGNGLGSSAGIKVVAFGRVAGSFIIHGSKVSQRQTMSASADGGGGRVKFLKRCAFNVGPVPSPVVVSRSREKQFRALQPRIGVHTICKIV